MFVLLALAHLYTLNLLSIGLLKEGTTQVHDVVMYMHIILIHITCSEIPENVEIL